MLTEGRALIGLAVGWGVFGLFHSITLERRVRARVRLPRVLERTYRLLYNAMAAVMLIALIAWARTLMTPVVYELQGPARWAPQAVRALGAALGLASTWQLGFLEFLGVPQIAGWRTDAVRGLRTDGLYALCRHPMGLGLMMMVWGTPRMSTAYLVSALCLTVYFGIGTWIEERALAGDFALGYQRYRARVPCLLPWPRPRAAGPAVTAGESMSRGG